MMTATIHSNINKKGLRTNYLNIQTVHNMLNNQVPVESGLIQGIYYYAGLLCVYSRDFSEVFLNNSYPGAKVAGSAEKCAN